MPVVVHATPADLEVIANLAEEMDRFYGETKLESLELRKKQIGAALFQDPPSAYCLLAWNDDVLAGFASYSFLWPAVGLTQSLYLKELYVAELARRQGVGKALMQNLCDIAVRHECSRVEWTTDKGNLEAQQFYSELGAPLVQSKLFYRIEGDEMHRYVSVNNPSAP